jgi:hypothetical protein
VTKEQADQFGHSLATLIAGRMREQGSERKFTLRMSNIGKGARQLWYDKKYGREEKLSAATLIKFMFGELTEQLLLFLASLSGHDVKAQQAEVTLGGIKGHIDAEINNVTVDIKSASSHGFKKFKSKDALIEDDPFGYVEQISGYSKARDQNGAFLAMDKVHGNLAYVEFPKEELAVFKVEERIQYLKEALDSPTPPPRCYDAEPMGTSGNMKLGTNCSYCDHKFRCWSDSNGGLGLRTFLYANGPVFLTEVKSEPKVFEKTF